MLSSLKSLFGGNKKQQNPAKSPQKQSEPESAPDQNKDDVPEYGIRSLEHARELNLAFVSNLLGVRAMETEASKAQEAELRTALDAEMAGMTERAIPKLSKSALSLMSDLLDPDTPQSKIVNAIKEDPALAGKVISVANSPLFIAPGVEIKDLEHALSMLGQLRLKDVVMASLVADKFKIDSYYFETFGQALWDHSSEVAVNARKIAEQSNANASLAYFVGLIHDIGKLVIFKKLVELHSKQQGEPHPQVFSNLLNDYSHALTRRACEVWALPEYWCKPIIEFQMAEPEHLIEPESIALFLANTFAELNTLFSSGEITQFELVWRLQEVGSSLEEFQLIYPEPEEE